MEEPSPMGAPRVSHDEPLGSNDLLHRLRVELAPDLEVRRYLGDEQFGRLYLAWEPALRRLVVVNVLDPQRSRSETNRLRFKRGARAAARISHPNVVPIYNPGVLADGTPYFTEEYVGECHLGERLTQRRRFEPQEVRKILHDVASALSAAHHLDIVHRGIHPGAIRCQDESDRVMLTDFGYSRLQESAGTEDEKLTPTGQKFPSAGYVSPEQIDGKEPATRSSDIYALGLLGWHLLAGAKARLPVADERPGTTWDTWADSVGDDHLADLILRCLSTHPHDRPTALDIVHDLEAERRPTGADGPDPSGGFWTWLSDHKIPHALVLYSPAAWVLLQFVDQLVQQEILDPPWYRVALATAISGLPAALVLAWHHGPRGRQRFTPTELLILGIIAVGWLVAATLTWINTGGG